MGIAAAMAEPKGSRRSRRMPPAIRPLRRGFFVRDPRRVARELLGKVLVRQEKGLHLTARIVEVEAYLGEKDPASHSFVGPTLRNAVLFGPPGYAYIYFIYGNHYCLNVSCLPVGNPGGVLFRAIEPLEGVKTMARLRVVPESSSAFRISGGPGRLCQALGITVAHSGLPLDRPPFALHARVGRADVVSGLRIGITKAVDLPWRYGLRGSRYLSKPFES